LVMLLTRSGHWTIRGNLLREQLQAAKTWTGQMGSTKFVILIRARARATLTEAVLERDHRMTGIRRGQSDKVEAPVGFEGEFWFCLEYLTV